MKKLTFLSNLVVGFILAVLSIATWAANPAHMESPKGVSSKTEVYLENTSPSIKNFTLKVDGTEKEQDVLNTVDKMVRNVLSNSQVRVNSVPVAGAPAANVKAFQNLEIIISATSPAEAKQPYKVKIALQEAGTTGESKTFDYDKANPQTFQKLLEAYLHQSLSLQPLVPNK